MNRTMLVVCPVLAVAGGLFICAVSLAAKRDSRLADIPRWTFSLVALFGILCAIWGALELTVFYCSAHLTSHAVYMLQVFNTLCAGVAIGLFLAWWMSGQIAPFFKKRSHT